jgi:hypothetical protein
MAKDTPERFAKLVLAELADIHALVMGIHDYIVADIAQRTGQTIEAVKEPMEKKRRERANRFVKDLICRVDFPKKDSQ